MPAPIDTASRTAALARAAFRVVLAEGLGGPPLRAIAREARLSAATILAHLESHARVLRLTTHYACDTIDAARGTHSGAAALVPAEDALEQARIWCLWSAFAEGDDVLSQIIEDQRERERFALVDAVPELEESDAELLHLAVEGARQAVARRASPCEPARAAALVARLEALLANEARLRPAS